MAYLLPSNTLRLWQPMRYKSPAIFRVFKHAATTAHTSKRTCKTPTIVSGPVMLAAPPRIVNRRQTAPQLTGRVRYNWQSAIV